MLQRRCSSAEHAQPGQAVQQHFTRHSPTRPPALRDVTLLAALALTALAAKSSRSSLRRLIRAAGYALKARRRLSALEHLARFASRRRSRVASSTSSGTARPLPLPTLACMKPRRPAADQPAAAATAVPVSAWCSGAQPWRFWFGVHSAQAPSAPRCDAALSA